MRLAIGFLRFWRDFIVGDDWRIAAGVAGVLGIGAFLVAGTSLPDAAIAFGVTAGIFAVVTATIVGER